MSSVVNRNNVLAGIFVVGSLTLAVVIAFILGDVMEKFGSKTEYVVRFPTTVGVTGLQAGADVTFAGLPVGRVLSVEPYTPDGAGTPPTAMDVFITVDSRITIHEDAFADLSPPLLGGVSRVNFASAGAGRLPPDAEDAALASNNGSGLLEEGEVVRGRFAPSILAQLGFTVEDAQKIKATIAHVEAATADAKDISARVRTMTGDYQPRVDAIISDAQNAVADVKDFTANLAAEGAWGGRIDSILASADETMAKGPGVAEDARATIATAREVIEENRGSVSRILANVEGSTERIKMQTLDQAERLIEQGTLALTSYRELAGNIDGAVTDARPDIRVATGNTRAITQQARLFLDEIRAQPWRLLKQPSESDLKREPLYAAARSYARSVSDLRAASEALDAAVRAAAADPTGPASPERIAEIAQAVQAAYADYADAERALLETLRSSHP